MEAKSLLRPWSAGSCSTLEDMTIQRMDNVGVVVEDLEAATAFFVELGLELEGEPDLGPNPPATVACRRGRGEILGQVSSTGRSSRDVDLMEFNELVPTVACRKPMIVGAAGFWSSLVTQSWTRCPARKRRALGTSGIR